MEPVKDSTPFKPAWWLNNAHLQTLYPALLRQVADCPSLMRERLELPDGDFVDLDWCGEGNGPLVILLHGLTGSSQSLYIKSLQHKFSGQGWRSVVLNFRGCSGESNRLARCYHSGDTEDIGFLYRTLKQREPHIPMAAVGFSLGGNVLLKWLGEEGGRLQLFAAVAVSVPLVLSLCASKLDTGFSRLYRVNLLQELKSYMQTKRRYLQVSGNQQEVEKIDQLGGLSDIRSFWQYDDRVVAKLHGFRDVHDYYRRSSSRQYLKTIALPTLVIQAADDPFMIEDVLPDPMELSSSVQMEITHGGGHVGFVGGRIPFRPHYWLDTRIPEFLNAQI